MSPVGHGRSGGTEARIVLGATVSAVAGDLFVHLGLTRQRHDEPRRRATESPPYPLLLTGSDGVTSIPLWGSKAVGAGGANEGNGGLVVDWRAGATASSASFAAVVPAGNGTNETS